MKSFGLLRSCYTLHFLQLQRRKYLMGITACMLIKSVGIFLLLYGSAHNKKANWRNLNILPRNSYTTYCSN